MIKTQDKEIKKENTNEKTTLKDEELTKKEAQPKSKGPGDISDIPLYTFLKDKSRKVTLSFRITFAIICFFSYVIKASTSYHRTFLQSFYYLTHVNLLFSSIFFIIGAIHSLKNPPNDSNFTKIYGYLHTTFYTSAGIITIFYWFVVAKADFSTFSDSGKCLSYGFCLYYTLLAHGFILFPTWISLFLERTNVTWKSVIAPLIYATVYFVWLIVISLVDGKVYPGMTFRDVQSYVMSLAAYVLLLLSFVGGLVLSRWKTRRLQNQRKLDG